MALVMGISDHVVVLDAGRPIAAGAPGRGAQRRQGHGGLSRQTARCGARPRGVPLPDGRAGRCSRLMRSPPATAPCRCCTASASGAPRRAGRAARRQRRRQVDRHARGQRAAAARVDGSIRARRRARRAARGAPHRAPPASRWCPKAGRCSPNSACATTSCSARIRARTPIVDAEIDALLERFPRLQRAADEPRRAAVGRRAADAGHRPRADGEARASCCSTSRRSGSRPAMIDELFEVARRAARRGHHHPAGRPDGGAGAGRRGSRLRAGIGPHRARRQRRGAARAMPTLEAAYLGGLEAAE